MAAVETPRNHPIPGLSLIVCALMFLIPPNGTTDGISVRGGTGDQTRMVEWAVGRFRSAGLALPSLEVNFHADPSGCAGNSGLYRGGRLDVCTDDQGSPYARKAIVHELSHAWIDSNVSAASRDEFLRIRGLETWNDSDQPWGRRGYEQAAEVITWFVGPGLTPLLTDHPDPTELDMPYRVLTGMAPPDLRP